MTWIDDAKKMGQPIRKLGRFSQPSCPIHGWICTRKKQSGKYIVWICTHNNDYNRIGESHWQFKVLKEEYKKWYKERLLKEGIRTEIKSNLLPDKTLRDKGD